jgi:hypothetical protein
VSSLHPIEGTLSAKPFGNGNSGRVHGTHDAPKTGTIHGGHEGRRGSIAGESTESLTSSATAELSGLISNLGTLSAQAQSLPLTPPVLPGIPQSQGYQPQTTDYTQFSNDAN